MSTALLAPLPSPTPLQEHQVNIFLELPIRHILLVMEIWDGLVMMPLVSA